MTAEIPKRVEMAPILAEVSKGLGKSLKEVGLPISPMVQTDFERACIEYRDQMSKSSPKLKIAVAGKFSCGKSQFINSLIGYEIAAVDLARTTCCKTIFTGDPSVDDIVILDAYGNSVTRDKYVELSSKRAASDQKFVVKIPNADWTDFEIIDTPGYDSIEKSDKEISEEAVVEADVVFFLFDMGNGTIPKDSIDYLERLELKRLELALPDQLLYLVANKADGKSPGAQQTIVKSIEEECLRKDIKYEDVLAYSSLTTWSKEVLQKSEPKRTNVLKLAGQLKEELMRVVVGLVERKQQIRDAKVSRLENDLRDRIEECWNKIGEAFSTISYEKFLGYFAEAAPDTDDTVKSVTNALMDFAADFTEGVARSLIHWREVPGTGILWTNWANDWRVSLDLPTDEYDSLGQGTVSLLQHLMSTELGEYQLADELPARHLINLIKPCSIEVVRGFVNNGNGWCSERCVVESDCRAAEERIRKRLISEFPDAFYKICRPKVAEIIKDLQTSWHTKKLYRTIVPLVKDLNAIDELLQSFDVASGAGKDNELGDEFLLKLMSAMNIVTAVTSGTVRYFVETNQFVQPGQEVARIVSQFSSFNETVRAQAPGRIVRIAEDGDTVKRLSPVFMLLPKVIPDKKFYDGVIGYQFGMIFSGMIHDKKLYGDATATDVKSIEPGVFPNKKFYGGATVEVVSRVTGVVESMGTDDGAFVEKDYRILFIDAPNIPHYPICAECDGVVTFRVKIGDLVKPGVVLASINTSPELVTE